MYLPESVEDNNTSSSILSFLGYNHNYELSSGEWYDMENLSTDNYPLLTPRKSRPRLVEGYRVTRATIDPVDPEEGDYWQDVSDADNVVWKIYTGAAWETIETAPTTYKDIFGTWVSRNIRGMLLTESNLAWLDGNVLHYNNEEYTMPAEITTDQQMIRFGAYILLFPAKCYFNVYTGETGTMGAKYTTPTGTTVRYDQSSATGTELTNLVISETAPANPSSGDYWLCTETSTKGLNQYSATDGWEPVTATYIRISVSGANLTDYFSVGDAVYMNSDISDINSGSIIVSMTDTYIVVSGLLSKAYSAQTTSAAWSLNIERKIPDMDYVCTADNRVWGCYYGYDSAGEIYNEIYACKLGDFKNWYTYAGLSTDSYSMSIGTPGRYTGAVTFQGYPTFFKENAILKIYGSTPSSYQLNTTTCRGVQQGSYKSLAIINEYLIYKSPSDIVAYDGSTPTTISSALGKTVYYDAVGGGCLNKYYVSMTDGSGDDAYFVYDLSKNVWMKEDPIDIQFFTSAENAQIYAANRTEIYGIGANDNRMFLEKLPSEAHVDWWCESGDLGLTKTDSSSTYSVGYKNLSSINMRAFIPANSEVQVWVSYDRKPYDEMMTLRGIGTLITYNIPVITTRCDSYRIKLIGHGSVRIYSMNVIYEEESNDNSEYHV